MTSRSNASPAPCALAHSYVKGVLLAHLGYFVHVAKSAVQPAPCQVWLGFEVDLACRVFRVPPEKLERFLALHTTINSFTRTRVTLRGRPGQAAAWPARSGTRQLG